MTIVVVVMVMVGLEVVLKDWHVEIGTEEPQLITGLWFSKIWLGKTGGW